MRPYCYRQSSVVCLSTLSVSLSRPWALQKRLNRSRRRSGCWLNMHPRSHVLDGVQIPMQRGGAISRGWRLIFLHGTEYCSQWPRRREFPVLSSSVPNGQPWKQLTVTSNFSNEKPPAMRPVMKILTTCGLFLLQAYNLLWWCVVIIVVSTSYVAYSMSTVWLHVNQW